MECPSWQVWRNKKVGGGQIRGQSYAQNNVIDNDQDGSLDVSILLGGVDVQPGTPIPLGKIRQPSEFVFLTASATGHQTWPKSDWTISGPLSPPDWFITPDYRHKNAGFPIAFADGHAASFRAVEHENTIANPPIWAQGPVYWANIPDRWWLLR